MKQPAVYILCNRKNGVLYTGVTSHIAARIMQHRSGTGSVFTQRYRCHRLVYIEFHDDIVSAIAREKQIKGGSRQKKVTLIESLNPEWADLFDRLNS